MERGTSEGACVHTDTRGPWPRPRPCFFENRQGCSRREAFPATLCRPTLVDVGATLDVYEVSWRVRAKSFLP